MTDKPSQWKKFRDRFGEEYGLSERLRRLLYQGAEVMWTTDMCQEETRSRRLREMVATTRESVDCKNRQLMEVIWDWLDKEMKADNMEEVLPEEAEEVLAIPLFAIPKKEKGKVRVIHNMKEFNKLCQPRQFRMQTINHVYKIWGQAKYGTKLDLKDAFHHVAIQVDQQMFFGMKIRDRAGILRCYRQKVIPFGWNQSPAIWDQVAQEIRRRILMIAPEVEAMIYVDDILILGTDRADLRHHTLKIVQALEEMGISVNHEKSITEPSDRLEYLGYLLDIEHKTIAMPISKRARVRSMAARELNCGYTTRRRIASLLGYLQGAREALQWVDAMTPNLYRFLYMSQNQGWNTPLIVWKSCYRELRYWANLKRWQSTRETQAHQVIVAAKSDASATGYGLRAFSSEGSMICHVEELWNGKELLEHSTERELRAAYIGLYQLAYVVGKNIKIIWETDCMAAASTLKRYRTRSKRLFLVGREIAKLVAIMKWTLIPKLIPREMNQDADDWSRAIKGRGYGTLMTVAEDFKRVLTSSTQWSDYKEPFAIATSLQWTTTEVWSQDWSGRVLLIPPVQIIEVTMERILAVEHLQAWIILPEWQAKWWWRPLSRRASKQIVVHNTHIRNIRGGAHIQTPWRHCAMLMNF